MVMNHLSHWLACKQLERSERSIYTSLSVDAVEKKVMGKSLMTSISDISNDFVVVMSETKLCFVGDFIQGGDKYHFSIVDFECIAKQNQLVTANMKTERRQILQDLWEHSVASNGHK